MRMSLVLLVAVLAGCVSPQPNRSTSDVSRQILFTVASDRALSSVSSSFSPVITANSSSAVNPGNETAQQSAALIRAVLGAHGLRKISQFPLHSLNAQAVVAEIRGNDSPADVVKALGADKRVQTVQQVRPYKLMSYNDPYFSLQGSVNSDRIDQVHKLFTGKGVVVGILDTGVDRRHPELADRIIYTSNSVAHDQGAFDRDEHGTAVAGVIGSAANNELGIVGVAPEARLMVFKACHQDIGSRRTACDSASIVRALNDVLMKSPDVLNLSLSGPRDALIERLLRAVVRQGTIIVAAVDESLTLAESFPASMPEVIAVGTLIELSPAFGDIILAPGTDMLTTAPGATYGFKSGSSMATAYVSGVVALMKDREPSLSKDEIFAHLKESSRLGENRLPLVDLCLAMAFGDVPAEQMCERTPAMAIRSSLSDLGYSRGD